MDDVVNFEVAKFRMEFEGSVSKISELCKNESVAYDANMDKYGTDDERTLLSAAKLSSCAIPIFCKSSMADLVRCASTNEGNINTCINQVESLVKCAVEKIHQPMYDFTAALRNQSRSYEPLPPQKNPTCKLNKKNNKHD